MLLLGSGVRDFAGRSTICTLALVQCSVQGPAPKLHVFFQRCSRGSRLDKPKLRGAKECLARAIRVEKLSLAAADTSETYCLAVQSSLTYDGARAYNT